jgi:hypothetical protein
MNSIVQRGEIGGSYGFSWSVLGHSSRQSPQRRFSDDKDDPSNGQTGLMGGRGRCLSAGKSYFGCTAEVRIGGGDVSPGTTETLSSVALANHQGT